MLYESHEILGTDKPIYKAIQEGQYSLEDIVNLRENPNDFKITGYVQVRLVASDKAFYSPVYERRG
ncbi:hypothetical protein [Gottfriedia solisilvae]|uniref:hypothetical protein n=1 Tax=Gottfriedia solisilvae TaxID=1516104 RepID=UPI003D2EEB3E